MRATSYLSYNPFRLIEYDLEMLSTGYYLVDHLMAVTATVCLGQPSPQQRQQVDNKHEITFDELGPCVRTDQKGAKLLGFSTGLAGVCRSCICNFQNALAVRHGAAQPKIKTAWKAATLLAEDLSTVVGRHFALEDGKWFNDWILKWPQTKQALIAESFRQDEYLPDRVKSFIKREVSKIDDIITKARAIQGYANLHSQSRFGPLFYALQKAFTTVLKRYKVPEHITGGRVIRLTAGSGMNPEDLGQFMSDCLMDYHDPYFYERDGKNWDATQQRAHHDLKRRFYSRALPRTGHVADFLRHIQSGFKVKGCARFKNGFVRYSLTGTVKSGHNDTTLGNTLVNLSIALEAAVRLGVDCDIIANGDDLLVIVEGDFDESDFAAKEAEYGIVPTFAKFHNYWQVEFCSNIFIPIGYRADHPEALRILAIPKPGRILQRTFWTVNPPGKKKEKEYMHSVTTGLMRVLHAVPIVNTFLTLHNPCPEKMTIAPIRVGAFKERTFHDRVVPCDAGLVRDWFRLRYGLTNRDIHLAESILHGLPIGQPVIIRDPLFARLAHIDTCDVGERFR